MPESLRFNDQTGVLEHEGYSYRYRYVQGARNDYAPVLFLGGAFQTMRSLAKVAEWFAAHADVVLVDLPGTGDSDLPPPELGGKFFADCVRRVMNRIGASRVNVVGVSFGTAIAYTVAQRHPSRVANLVLVGTMSHADRRIEEALELSFEALDGGDMKGFADRVSSVLMNHGRRRQIPQFERGERLLRVALGRMRQREIEQFRVNGERILLHRRLDTSRPVPVRALVFTGEHDTVTTPGHCLEVASTIGDAHWVLVRDADHLVVLERFEVCARLTDSFLRGRAPRSAPDFAAVRRLGGGETTGRGTRIADKHVATLASGD